MKSDLNLNKHRKSTGKAIRRAASYAGSVTASPSKKTVRGVIILLVLLFALFFTLNDMFFNIEGMPTWEDLYKGAGLTEDIPLAQGDVSVHFADVGQGDCELIRTASKAVLIDCGEKQYFSDVIAYIKSQDIKRLDYVVVTHPHSDHMGGMSYILDEFEVGVLIMPKVKKSVTPTTGAYTRLLKAVSDNGVSMEYARAGAEYLLDDAVMTLLSPVEDYDDLNNYSVAVKLTHGENSFLFTGDIEKKAESDILESGANVSADVLKIAHHGSSTSSGKSFLKAVSPSYAVIEVGSPNDYGHPHNETVEQLEKMDIKIYRTDIHGNIVFISSGSELEIFTENEMK
ncbi:MAG: MBL fold metallo-hydrolase [Bacteroides sp.]|nr:MBL fold metallo-hydrolase [Bacteroides sp.]